MSCHAGPPVNSRLGSIITAYLRQQHRAACLTAAQPVSVVPPVSLLKPYSLPVATRPLSAPANVTLRLARHEVWGGFGGRGKAVCGYSEVAGWWAAALYDVPDRQRCAVCVEFLKQFVSVTLDMATGALST
jgi:hypothetical protein